jgi:flagellar biosynthesis regulator FlbT
MPEHGRLLICDQILQPDPSQAPPTDYLVDIQMMAMFGAARERTEDEFADLLAAAGLTLRRVISTGSTVQIVEAGPG